MGLFALYLVSFLALHSNASMDLSTLDFFHKMQSEHLKVIEQGDPNYTFQKNSSSAVDWIRKIKFFGTLREGEPHLGRPECSLETWQREFLKKRNLKEQAESLRNLFSRCDRDFQSGIENPWLNMILSMTYRIDTDNHPTARQVMWTFESGLKLRGLLGLKTDGKKRPLLIYRAGIFSDSRDFIAERWAFMILFEQSPFHVLMLESMSGPTFVNNNSDLGLGGFDEGLQNYSIAREIQKSKNPLSRITSEVLMLSTSMGGHGGLVAAALNEVNPPKVFTGFIGFCPLVQFQNTFVAHQKNETMSKILNYWSSRRLPMVQERYPQVKAATFMDDVTQVITQKGGEPLVGWPWDWKEPIEVTPRMKALRKDLPNHRGFWEMNHIEEDLPLIETPQLIFATQTDWIVPLEMNSGFLQSSPLLKNKENFQVLHFDQGMHCTLGVAYRWHPLSQILVESSVAQTQKTLWEYKTQVVPLLPSEVVNTDTVEWRAQIHPQTGEIWIEAVGWGRFLWEQRNTDYPKLSLKGDPDSQNIMLRWLHTNLYFYVDQRQLHVRWRGVQ